MDIVYENLIPVAEKFARDKHAGQVDKAGVDYINHPLTVASFVDDQKEKCVALLHDTVEDTDTTLDDIRALFGKEIADCIFLLTRPEEMSYQDYLKRLMESGNVTAMHVKLADLRHNSDVSRLGDKADEPESIRRLEKYAGARADIEAALARLEQEV